MFVLFVFLHKVEENVIIQIVMYVVSHPGTIIIVNWTYFDSGYVSLPILAASAGLAVVSR